MIRAIKLTDASAIAEIYNYYIRETIITFELEPIDADDIKRRIKSIAESQYPWLCYVDSETDVVIGYAYAARWRERVAYNHVVESAIYLRPGFEGRGIGKQLYRKLFDNLVESGFKSVVAGISIPNPGSIAIHESFGFRKVGLFRKVGRKFDRWIDVEFQQLELT